MLAARPHYRGAVRKGAQATPVPAPTPPRPNGSGLWGRIQAWLMA